MPAPVIDTVLDDRDGGIVPFGEKNVIVTSFNNTTDFQRSFPDMTTDYDLSYLDTVTREEENVALGSNFRISNDIGYPSTIELDDGSLLTVFYAIPVEGETPVIMQQKWRFENEI